MIAPAGWSLDPKFLDAYLQSLGPILLSEHLRRYELVLLPDGTVDAHASAYARAYRVRAPDSSIACLRFWLNTVPTSILETYAALEHAPEVRRRCGVLRAALFSRAIEVKGAAIPAVLMDWVEGSALGDTVTAHLANAAELLRIAEALQSTFNLLNLHRTSHGDLRSSNILIASRRNSVRASLIDLDSLRWHDGPTTPREIGGNTRWNDIRHRDGVTMLESDYLDQAETYLSIVAVAAERSLWRGPTDGFLMLKSLRADSEDDVLRLLEQMNGTPSRLATAVRRAIDQPGHWSRIADAMRHPTSTPLSERAFWDIASWRATPKTAPAVRPVPELLPPVPRSIGNTLGPPVTPKPPAAHKRSRIRLWQWFAVLVLLVALVLCILYLVHKPQRGADRSPPVPSTDRVSVLPPAGRRSARGREMLPALMAVSATSWPLLSPW